LTVFVRPCSEKLWIWRTKATQIILFSRAAKDFAIGEQKQLKIDCFCSAAAAKNFGIGEQKQLKLTVFVQLRSEKFCNWRTKATQN
jgi:hypothetical protein